MNAVHSFLNGHTLRSAPFAPSFRVDKCAWERAVRQARAAARAGHRLPDARQRGARQGSEKDRRSVRSRLRFYIAELLDLHSGARSSRSARFNGLHAKHQKETAGQSAALLNATLAVKCPHDVTLHRCEGMFLVLTVEQALHFHVSALT
jgi:hypothetical protein